MHMKMASAVRGRLPGSKQRGRNLELDVGGFAHNEDVEDWMLPVTQNAGLHQPIDT